jgi:ATP-dependent 26S proteasome regulatory subunit
MLSIQSAIASRMGAFWVQTQDYHRLVDLMIENRKQDNVFIFDPFEGLLQFIEDRWRTVVIPDPNDPKQHITIMDPGLAFMHIVAEDGVYIVGGAENVAADLYAPVISLMGKYRASFLNDNTGSLGACIIFVSTTTDVPEIYGRNMPFVSMPLPTREDIVELYRSIATFNPHVVGEKDNAKALVESSVGLSESELITAATEMISSSGFVDAVRMDDLRTSLLKSGSQIDLIEPKITFDSLGGLDIAKKLIIESAKLLSNPETAAKARNKIMLVGVPGCGKSALCEATASELGLKLARTGVTQQMSKWIGESEANMRHTLATINAMAPVVWWVDEFGRDLSGGGTSNDGGTTDRVQGELLTGMQELPDNVYLMAAANRIDGLAPEMLRQGRWDEILFVGFPSQSEREDILKIYIQKAGWTNVEDFDIVALAGGCEGFTGGEIESSIQKLDFLHNSDGTLANTSSLAAVFGDQTNLMIVRHRGAMAEMYKRAVQEWTFASSAQRVDAARVINGEFGRATHGVVDQPVQSISNVI